MARDDQRGVLWNLWYILTTTLGSEPGSTTNAIQHHGLSDSFSQSPLKSQRPNNHGMTQQPVRVRAAFRTSTHCTTM